MGRKGDQLFQPRLRGREWSDIAIQSKPELLSVPGVAIVPGDMAFTVVYAGGVQVGTTQTDAAKAFVNYLKSPEAQAVFKAKGYDPA
ncbi:MAG TPA: substrate-binding domain-containing protein [Pseudolabrys sp.]|nr:substrate-binding domain-containing protein [Pseudolabrys sp.]